MLTQHTTTDTAAYRRNSSSTLDLPAIVYAPRPRVPKQEPARAAIRRPRTPAAAHQSDLAGFSFSRLPEAPRSPARGTRDDLGVRPGTRLGLFALAAMLLLGSNHPTGL